MSNQELDLALLSAIDEGKTKDFELDVPDEVITNRLGWLIDNGFVRGHVVPNTQTKKRGYAAAFPESLKPLGETRLATLKSNTVGARVSRWALGGISFLAGGIVTA